MAQIKIEFVGDPSSAQQAIRSISAEGQSAASTMAGVFGGIQLSELFNKAKDKAAEMFEEWHTGWQSMAAQTGAEGSALGGLTDSMAKVGAEVPASLGEIGKTMGELAARTHLTGEPLEHMTAQFADLQHLGMPVTVEAATRAFGQWGVATEDQSGKLDQMFRLSQQTGTSMQTIFASLQSAGPIFQTFGFSIDEGAAMIAKWNAEGINTDKVIAGMRKALAYFGGDVEANDKIVEESKIKIPQLQEAYTRAAEGVTVAAENVAKAQKHVEDAMTSAAEGNQRATDGLAAANQGLDNSYRSVQDRIQSVTDSLNKARQALEDAKKPAGSDDLERASLSLEHAQLNQAKAVDEVQKAENDLETKRHSSTATMADIALAESRVADARLNIRDTALATRDAEARLTEVQQKGSETDKNVISAKQGVVLAEKAQADTARQTAEEITAARKRVSDAEDQVAKAAKTGSDQIAAARQSVTDAERKLGDARVSAADAADKLQVANDKLNAALKPPPGDLREQLEATFKSIKDAPTDFEGAQIAMQVFGKRAGADMVPLIRSGKMSVDDLMKSVAAGKGTITGTEEKTKDLKDRIQELKNQMSAALGPFGEIGVVLQQVGGFLVPAAILFKMFGGAAAEAGAEGAAGGIAFDLAWLPIIAIVLAVAAAAYLIIDNWSEISSFFEGVGGAIYDALAWVWNWIQDHWRLIVSILTGPFGAAIIWIVDNWNGILDFFSGIVEATINIFESVGKGIANAYIWGINEVISAWNWMMDQLKIPGFDVGPVHFGGLDLGSELKISKIPYLAEGGVAWGPTLAMIAEGGRPERIESLDAYEQRMGERGGGGGNAPLVGQIGPFHGYSVSDARKISEIVRIEMEKVARRNGNTGVRSRSG